MKRTLYALIAFITIIILNNCILLESSENHDTSGTPGKGSITGITQGNTIGALYRSISSLDSTTEFMIYLSLTSSPEKYLDSLSRKFKERFQFDELSPGIYNVLISNDSIKTIYSDIEVRADENTEIVITIKINHLDIDDQPDTTSTQDSTLIPEDSLGPVTPLEFDVLAETECINCYDLSDSKLFQIKTQEELYAFRAMETNVQNIDIDFSERDLIVYIGYTPRNTEFLITKNVYSQNGTINFTFEHLQTTDCIDDQSLGEFDKKQFAQFISIPKGNEKIQYSVIDHCPENNVSSDIITVSDYSIPVNLLYEEEEIPVISQRRTNPGAVPEEFAQKHILFYEEDHYEYFFGYFSNFLWDSLGTYNFDTNMLIHHNFHIDGLRFVEISASEVGANTYIKYNLLCTGPGRVPDLSTGIQHLIEVPKTKNKIHFIWEDKCDDPDEELLPSDTSSIAPSSMYELYDHHEGFPWFTHYSGCSSCYDPRFEKSLYYLDDMEAYTSFFDTHDRSDFTPLDINQPSLNFSASFPDIAPDSNYFDYQAISVIMLNLGNNATGIDSLSIGKKQGAHYINIRKMVTDDCEPNEDPHMAVFFKQQYRKLDALYYSIIDPCSDNPEVRDTINVPLTN